jgi:hypothetical protein
MNLPFCMNTVLRTRIEDVEVKLDALQTKREGRQWSMSRPDRFFLLQEKSPVPSELHSGCSRCA